MTAQPLSTETLITAVCSNRPKPSVQRGAKGSQWWKRDVYHVATETGRTLCGLDCTEWLVIGQVAMDSNCCKRCFTRCIALA